MILDKGICTIYHKTNTAGPGMMPVYQDVEIWQSWYGELAFETSPGRPTDYREEVQTDARVRILQNRAINNHDRVELSPLGGSTVMYEVTRAYHGWDEDAAELITDLTLQEVRP